ncbi:MAG: hypothetical protein HeimC3_48310 [Candidatus Heimdallarchaeota archaeon LC_3]|nr:MAG: hypothetical protein HeimC3_48310 [Candidatus Heimdallarchaeota archaeon LC_3]
MKKENFSLDLPVDEIITYQMPLNTKTKPSDSLIDLEKIESIYQEIIDLYTKMQCPWVIGYSGGKDSTATLQMIWHSLKLLEEKERKYNIYVFASDTMVENPTISFRINEVIKNIREASKKDKLPIFSEIVYPEINNSFWVNLIGKGYPTPSQKFRWCTDRLKIRPINRAIEKKLIDSGRVVIALGTRLNESQSRNLIMKNNKVKSSFNNKITSHPHLHEAYIYSPIQDFDVDDVWGYLLKVKAPWKASRSVNSKIDYTDSTNDNEILYDLYRDAHGGECPLVIDQNTEPCGGSRFGCWTCTLVTHDKTAETLIKNGQTWLKPLVEIRRLLKRTQNPENKEIYRDYKRRNGQISFNSNEKRKNEVVPGSYKLEFRKKLLRKILKAQEEILVNSPYKDIKLIREEELLEIRRLWRVEKGDWEDSVPKIVKEVSSLEIDWLIDDLDIFTKDEKTILEKFCKEENVPTELVIKLIEAEREMDGMLKRTNKLKKIIKISKEEWRSLKEVLEERIHE